MKIAIVVVSALLVLFIVFQMYISMVTNKSEQQAYKVIRKEKEFEIRYYPAAVMAKISSSSKSYRDLGYSGFGKLAKYIFGGNSEQKQIAMTSPVHMDIGDTVATMAFVMPAKFKKEDLPKPDNTDIQLEVAAAEYVAALQFDGFANTASIDKNKALLKKQLTAKGISFYGNFRFLGYNPPYQLFGRRNEVIVSVNFTETTVQPSVIK